MLKPFLFFFFILLFRVSFCEAKIELVDSASLISKSDTAFVQLLLSENDTTSNRIFSIGKELKKRMVIAMFAFPFPFGFMGTHRVMLGCKPWIPIVYVATLGGCLGVLPLIDFCVVTFSKNLEQYENNPAIFMWMK